MERRLNDRILYDPYPNPFITEHSFKYPIFTNNYLNKNLNKLIQKKGSNSNHLNINLYPYIHVNVLYFIVGNALFAQIGFYSEERGGGEEGNPPSCLPE